MAASGDPIPQRWRRLLGSWASYLGYKLPHEFENPSRGKAEDHLAWQLIELASTWHWVGAFVFVEQIDE